MPSPVLRDQAMAYVKKRPEIRPGYTVRVHERIQEGDKERTQVFDGLVISVHRGHTPTDSTFTVRRTVSGVGVEKVYSLHSPRIEKIEVKKVAKVRRAKLFFLRGRHGKASRLSERFTTADEFAVLEDDTKAPGTAAEAVEAGESVVEEEKAPEADAAGKAEAPEKAEKKKEDKKKDASKATKK